MFSIFFVFQGGVILVSHDERLLKMVCQELWVCSKGKVYSLEGGLDQYRRIVEKEMILAWIRNSFENKKVLVINGFVIE